MSNFWKRKVERIGYILANKDKEFAEIKFWRRQIDLYIKWFKGEINLLYGHKLPPNKVTTYDDRINAILTFFEVHQKTKYANDLLLKKDEFIGKKVLDIGSGPFPSGLCFIESEIYSLDPLMDAYISAGYPIHTYENRAKFVKSMAEAMPFPDGYFDAVISVNAIDHVNDFEATAKEIKRVLKTDGRFRMHVHYHPKTKAEPLELNDEVFLKNYSWVTDLKKIETSKVKTGTKIVSEDELYVVWGN